MHLRLTSPRIAPSREWHTPSVLQLLSMAGLSILFWGCNPGESPSDSATSPAASVLESQTESSPLSSASTPLQADGAALFQQHCQACHGGQGTGGMGPALTAVGSKGHDTIANFVRQGSPGNGMPAFQVTLSPVEINAVASYVLSLTAPLPASPPPATPPRR